MSQALREAWRALQNEPLAFVDPQCLEAALLGAQNAGQVAELARQPRFQARIEQLLVSFYGLQPLQAQSPADADLPVLLLPVTRFRQLPTFCGACLHGASLAREIRGSRVQQLRTQLGDEVYTLAVSWREAAVAKTNIVEGEALLAAIEQDGRACVEAWMAAQPAALQAWLQLRFDLAAPLSDGRAEHAEHVRRVAAELAADERRGAA